MDILETTRSPHLPPYCHLVPLACLRPQWLVLGHHHRQLGRYPSNWSFCFYSYSFQSLLNSASRMLFLNFMWPCLCLQHVTILPSPVCKSQHSQYGDKILVVWGPASLSWFSFHLLSASALRSTEVLVYFQASLLPSCAPWAS